MIPSPSPCCHTSAKTSTRHPPATPPWQTLWTCGGVLSKCSLQSTSWCVSVCVLMYCVECTVPSPAPCPCLGGGWACEFWLQFCVHCTQPSPRAAKQLCCQQTASRNSRPAQRPAHLGTGIFGEQMLKPEFQEMLGRMAQLASLWTLNPPISGSSPG